MFRLIGTFREPMVRRGILFTLLAVALLRLGQNLPLPGVDAAALDMEAARAAGDSATFRLLDLLSGGGLGELAVFSTGIWPYILAGTVLSRLVRWNPRLRALAEAGSGGAARLTRYRRFITIVLGLAQGAAIVAIAESRGVLAGKGFAYLAGMTVCLALGSAVVMVLAGLIDFRGVGPGAGILLAAAILAVLPEWFRDLYAEKGAPALATALILVVLTVAGKICLEQSSRRVPVQYARRMVGRRTYGGTANHISIAVAGRGGEVVLSVSRWLFLPVTAADLWPGATWLQASFLQDEGDPWHIALYFGLIVVYGFVAAVAAYDFAAGEAAMRQSGAFVPGIRPGPPTTRYLGYVVVRVAVAGSLAVGVVAALPVLGFALLGAGPDLWFASAIVFFLVDVSLGTARQMESLAMMRRCGGVLR